MTPDPRSCYSGPNARALRAWIEENDPALNRELEGQPRMKVLAKLNEVTGCTFTKDDWIERSCSTFLAALKKIKETS